MTRLNVFLTTDSKATPKTVFKLTYNLVIDSWFQATHDKVIRIIDKRLLLKQHFKSYDTFHIRKGNKRRHKRGYLGRIKRKNETKSRTPKLQLHQ